MLTPPWLACTKEITWVIAVTPLNTHPGSYFGGVTPFILGEQTL